MAIQKKHGKGRLDKWYKLAKEKGYRARAAFKLIQLNKKYGFLEKSKVLLDLCAAPGSWCQVAAETMPVGSIIIGVDLAPIKSIPKVITFQSDITTDVCRATIRQHLKTWKADTVLHDGAPNVGTAWSQDSFNQAELVLQAMKLATEFLVEGGTFVTKVFRSKDYNPLLWVFNQLFTKVEATKPPSSRNVSAEIFVVCKGYKAPKKLDPKFLDPRSVFADLAEPTPNNEAKVYNPDVKKRKREGYEEGDWTQFKEVSVAEFIETVDPIAILGSSNRLTFDPAKGPDATLSAWLAKIPETTDEIRTCCEDLRVLGRKEFKLLLKWRLIAKAALERIRGEDESKAEPEQSEQTQEVAEVGSMAAELALQEELQALKEKDDSKKKRERRRANEKKQKEIVRLQLHMGAPLDIGLEQSGPLGQDSMFALKPIDKADALKSISRGKMGVITPADTKRDRDSGIGSSTDTEEDSDPEEDRLERELDGMYDQYREKKAERDAKYRAKKARQEHDDGEWEGVSADEKQDSDDDIELDDSSDEDDEDDETPNTRTLLTDLDNEPSQDGSLSKRAQRFFNQDVFKGIAGIIDDVEELEISEKEEAPELEKSQKPKSPKEKSTKSQKESKKSAAKSKTPEPSAAMDSEESSDDEVEFKMSRAPREEYDWEEKTKAKSDGTLDIDIVTAEAMTLAHQLATGEKSRHDVVDEGFNRYAFKDKDGLPDWFLDDEHRHDKPHRPITKAAAAAIKEKLRAYNARPMKKVAEAKARKKLHAAQRLEKLRKKSDLLAAEEGMTEKEKADTITKMLARAARKKTRVMPRLVVAKGVNKGIKGRPKGVKGRYKIVDPRMKKEIRAQKRIAKRK